jgi:hypothetical protein
MSWNELRGDVGDFFEEMSEEFAAFPPNFGGEAAPLLAEAGGLIRGAEAAKAASQDTEAAVDLIDSIPKPMSAATQVGSAVAARGATVAAEDAIRLHHAWPKYLGGAAKQDLAPLSKSLHDAFHSGLDKILPRQWGSAYYESLGPAARQQVLQDLGAYTKAFDAKYGTQLYDALLRNGFPGP